MKKLIFSRFSDTSVCVLLESGEITEIIAENDSDITGNIYKASVKKILPGMRCAFASAGRAGDVFVCAGHSFDIEKIEPDSEIVVQITRPQDGEKCAQGTQNLSFPGIYSVFFPYSSVRGVSKKIEDTPERERLKKYSDIWCDKNEGIVFRTAAENVSEEILNEEIKKLKSYAAKVISRAKEVQAPYLLYSELPFEIRTIRDIAGREITVICDDEKSIEILSQYREYLERISVVIEQYTGSVPLYENYGIFSSIAVALKNRIPLDCGGFITFDRCEGLTAVDVNTGSFHGEEGFERTAFIANCEAARQTAHQIRLRNTGGIIVIDFIDMKDESHCDALMKLITDELKKDRAKTHFSSMNEFGMVEITRQKDGSTIEDIFLEQCSCCRGRGMVPAKKFEKYLHNYF